MTYTIILLIVGAALYAIGIYNKLVKNRAQIDEGWSGIAVQLKRRHDLIPNLVNTVKGFAAHEKSVFIEVTELRNISASASSTSATNVAATAQAESALSAGITKLFAVAENYPELKSNENFLKLQSDLGDIENSLQHARRYYNGAVRDYQITRESFPSNIVANKFNFEAREYFELEDVAKESATPVVNF